MRAYWENHNWIKTQLAKKHLSKTFNNRLYAISVDTGALKGLMQAFRDVELEELKQDIEKIKEKLEEKGIVKSQWG